MCVCVRACMHVHVRLSICPREGSMKPMNKLGIKNGGLNGRKASEHSVPILFLNIYIIMYIHIRRRMEERPPVASMASIDRRRGPPCLNDDGGEGRIGGG
eukprot:GHVU01040900.1.p2 GENE.GHVU01040900.1~~GHVU01040900.1.p2  ORF type:complete len:100 (+),score=10.23 GHVU01040900.1:1474-1773(+)